MARKPSNISILEFDSQSIIWLRAEPSEAGVAILDFVHERGPWTDGEDALENALRAFVEAHPIAEDNLYTVLPRHEITTRIVDLPTESEEEAASMIRFSAEDFVPYPVEELIIDQTILQKAPGGESRVLAVLAHRDVVQGHIDLLAKVSLEPEQIFLSTACLASAAAEGKKGSGERYALVHLASGGLECIAMDRGQLAFTRGVHSAQDWSSAAGEDGAEAFEELAVEMRGSLSAYRRETEDGMGAEQVYLCSEWTGVQALAESLFNETGKEVTPAEFAREVVERGGDKLDCLPMAAIGAALSAQGRARYAISLLPEAMTEGRQRAGMQRLLLHGLAAAGVVIACLLGLFLQQAHVRNAYIQELEQQVYSLSPQAEGVAGKQEMLMTLRRQVDRTGSAVELLTKVTEAAPEEGLNITRFTYDRNEGVNLWGRAETRDEVHMFAQSLRTLAESHLPFWAAARSMYEEESRERNETIYLYQVEVAYTEGEDVEPGA